MDQPSDQGQVDRDVESEAAASAGFGGDAAWRKPAGERHAEQGEAGQAKLQPVDLAGQLEDRGDDPLPFDQQPGTEGGSRAQCAGIAPTGEVPFPAIDPGCVSRKVDRDGLAVPLPGPEDSECATWM